MEKINNHIDKWKSRFKGLLFFSRNMVASLGMKALPSIGCNGYHMAGLNAEQIPALDKLHRSLRNNRPLSKWKKLLLKYRGRQLCVIIMDGDNQLVGTQLHFFTKKEMAERILHIEYGGLCPKDRGKGLSSAISRHLATHYANQGITGLSAATQSGNSAALRATESIGFEVVARPDGTKGPVRLYLDLSKFKL